MVSGDIFFISSLKYKQFAPGQQWLNKYTVGKKCTDDMTAALDVFNTAIAQYHLRAWLNVSDVDSDNMTMKLPLASTVRCTKLF